MESDLARSTSTKEALKPTKDVFYNGMIGAKEALKETAARSLLLKRRDGGGQLLLFGLGLI